MRMGGERIFSSCSGSGGEVQSTAPFKKAGSELGALAIEILEAQCGSPRGNWIPQQSVAGLKD